MNHARSALVALFLIAVILTANVAVAQCGPTPAGANDDFQDLTIDARFGTSSFFPSSYTTGDRVRIVVTNKNPFRFQYKLDVAATPVREEALAAFLKLPVFAGLVETIGPKPEAEQPKPVTTPSADGLEAVVFCDPSWYAKLAAAQELLEELAAMDAAAQAAASGAATKLNAGKTAFDLHRPQLMSDVLECSDVRSHAQTLSGAIDLGGVSQLLAMVKTNEDSLRGGSQFLLARVTALEAELAALRQTAPDCYLPPEPDRALDVLRLAANGGLRRAKLFTDSREKMTGLQGLLAKTKKEIDRTLARPDAFYSIAWVGGYRRPTDVTIDLSRKDNAAEGADFVAFSPIELNFGGGPRFVLAAGLAFANLEVREYKRVQGFPRDLNGDLILDDDGEPGLTNVIGLTEDSDGRLVPLLILHARPSNREAWKRFYISLGLTAHADNQGADLEVLVGPSWAVVGDQFFITVGAYYGRRQTLAGDLYVGAPVPEDLAELPVRKDREWAAAVAFSYKIK